MQTISFTRHRFPPDVIRHAVWLYARFTLSFRDVEDLLAERGLDISYETVRRWFLKFGVPIARNLRHMRPTRWDGDCYSRVSSLVMACRRQWRRGPGFSRAIKAERQGGVEVVAEIVEEARVGANADHNR